MRRFISAVVLVLFVLQSSGAAVAAQPSGTNARPLFAEVQFAFTQALQSFGTTHIGALLSGQESLYEAMHQPPPDFRAAHALRDNPQPPIMHYNTTPMFHPGTEVLTALDRDPSMARPNQNASRFAASRRSQALEITPPKASGHLHTMSVGAGNGSGTTGVNRWWTYEEGGIPGAGKWMVDVGTGNLLVQEEDVDVPERGIDLAFQRTYNSQSQHDYANTDGSVPSNFGDGWTNTFDAHVTFNTGLNGTCPTAQGITMYDIDGARYDFTPDCVGGYTPPPGLQGTTLSSYSNGCVFEWTKKFGTTYGFFSPNYNSTTCSAASWAGYNGRLWRIWARNNNNNLVLHYYWDNGDSSSASHLNEIDVVHSDGQQLTLRFADFNGYRELASVTRPDAVQITYQYDGSGDLGGVFEPVNNSNYGYHQYQWWSGQPHQLLNVVTPVYAQNSGNKGGVVTFHEDASYRATSVALNGWGNFIPDDGTGLALQPTLAQQAALLRSTTFSYTSADETQLTDTDGHATNWWLDTIGRVKTTQEWAGAPNNLWLQTTSGWDANNNLTSTTDPRANATYYSYDSNGNTVAVGLPSVNTSQGTFRPTTLYSYDGHNNIVAACDANFTHQLGKDWTTNPGSSDSLCPVQAGATRYTWDTTDTNQPFGRLTDTYTPLGYHAQIRYDSSSQAGIDAGLPTSVQGDAISQTIDGTTPTRTPTQTFVYNGYGSITNYNKGNGTWSLSYDALNRVLVTTDPDNVSSYKCYYQDGQLQYDETAAQHAADGSPASCQTTSPANAVGYTYDADGNEVGETHHYGSATGLTQKWYDGLDRLVEVQQPRDPNGNDYYAYAWLTRYIYDLSQDGTVSVDNASFSAHGNLYKTQEYIPGNPIVQVGSTLASPQWTDVRGTSFDALDRALAAYENSFGTTPKLANTYDGAGYYGLLSQTQNATGQQSTLTYDAAGRLYQKQYQNDGGVTPWGTYTYDPDGRATTVNSSQFGSETHTFDADGRLTTLVEPSGGGYTSPATITYDYYPDGMRKDLSVSSSAFTQSNLFQYSYRTDGELQKQQVNGTVSGAFGWTYTNAGRELTQSDPYTGSVITLYNAKDVPTGSTRTLQAKTYTYDSYGRVASLVLPEGYTYNTFTYDPEDETTGYARANAYCANGDLTTTTCMGTRGQTYSVRAELAKVSDPSVSATAGNGPIANGTVVQSTLTQFDARSGMVMGMTSKNYSSQSYNVTGAQTYAHDGAGRQTTLTENYNYNGAYTAYATRGYDAENHVVSQSYTNATFYCADSLTMCGQDQVGGTSGVSSGIKNTYGWGPNGHPILLQQTLNGSTTNTGWGGVGNVSLHWDGDDVLLAVGGSTGVDVEIGKLGVTNESTYLGMTVTDRDMSGAEVASHNATSFGAWSSAPPTKTYKVLCTGCQNENGFVSGAINSNNDQYATATQYLSTGRTDGYDDGYGNTFQGVRAYDENTSQWTAPDAYAGDVHDPMSQKPFMWNNNNPLQFEDPSGYVAITQQSGNSVTITLTVQFDKSVDASTKKKIMDDISKTWTGQFGKYSVTMKVLEATAATSREQINKVVVGPPGTHYGGDVLNSRLTCDAYGLPTAYAHEAGHLMGLGDAYLGAGTKDAKAIPGYSGESPDDIMVRLGGAPSQADIDAILMSSWNIHS